jgi:hypothetical protein
MTLRVGSLPEGVGQRLAERKAGAAGESSSLAYLVPILVLGFAIFYQFLGGAEMLGMAATKESGGA